MAEVAPKGITRDQRWSLEGQTALVTGGTKGIGHAIVEELVGFGAIVHTCARNKSDLDRCLEEWKSKGFRVTGSVCDVSQRDQREKLVETVSSLFNGKLNILVNNAGIVIPKLATEFTVEDVSILFATNFESGFGFCQALHPLLKASGNGSIVFNSSVASVMALPYLSVYGATKGAINQLTRSLACEWAKDNIRINSIAPGATKTDMLSYYSSNIRDEDQVYDGRTPLNRLGEPNEISSVVTFLCLPAAAYITGQVICIDGGFNVNGLPSSQ